MFRQFPGDRRDGGDEPLAPPLPNHLLLHQPGQGVPSNGKRSV